MKRLLLTALMFWPQALLAQDASRSWTAALDLRDLPAHSRPARIAVEVDTREAVRRGYRPVVSVAVNGLVVAHRSGGATRPVRLDRGLQDRLLSVSNSVEVATTIPNCATDECRRVLDTVRPTGPVRYVLGAPEGGTTDFSQLPTRLLPGVEVVASGPRDRRLAEQVLAALAPRAPIRKGAAARIVVSDMPPADTRPPIRFDLGPVRLDRPGERGILTADTLDRLTAVQMLRGGERPLIWVRPGALAPGSFQLNEGDVALFDAGGRVMAWSTLRDRRAVRVAYAPGVDPNGDDRATLMWRLALLGTWIVATIFTVVVLRRLPKPQKSVAA